MVAALNGLIPVVAAVDQRDAIAAVLRLQAEYNFSLVIKGGAEAHTLADEVAAARASVLLRARVSPSNFDLLRQVPAGASFVGRACRRRATAGLTAAAPGCVCSATPLAASILKSAGVNVGLYVPDPDNGRNLRWEAGAWLRRASRRARSSTHDVHHRSGYLQNHGLNFTEALASVTTNLAAMFPALGAAASMSLDVGARANLVAFDDDPLSLRSHVQLVASGEYVHCKPKQF